ncbi:MAG: ABC-type transport auxiliary lipoprotein family protein [Sulfuricurvum sp.]|nr:ABC-type transport auxiliary lipoprotein family protein [Sulfuricurvum sp.]
MQKFLLSILSLFLLSGCSLKNSAVLIKEHTIDSKVIENKKNNIQTSLSIKIQPLMTNDIYNTNHMWYKKGSLFSYFAYNQWVIAPIDLISQRAESALIAHNMYKGVLSTSSKANTDLTLEIEVVDFYQEFNANGSHVIMQIKANLISNNGNELLKTKNFHFHQQCPSNDPNGGVKTFEMLLGLFSNDLVNMLSV